MLGFSRAALSRSASVWNFEAAGTEITDGPSISSATGIRSSMEYPGLANSSGFSGWLLADSSNV
ncbi:hypothetical protein D3C71_1476830 [compost metagenome]